MLCPSCGKPVGDKAALCSACAEAKKSSATRAPDQVLTPSKEESQGLLREAARPELEEPAIEMLSEEQPPLAYPSWFIPFLIVDIAILICAIAGLYYIRHKPSPTVVTTVTYAPRQTAAPVKQIEEPLFSTSSSGAALQSSSGITTAPEEEVQVTIPTIPVNTIGVISVNGTQYEFISAAFLYFKRYKRLEVGFYREALAPREEQQLRAKQAIAILNGKVPMLVVNVVFSGEPRSADKNAATSLNISFRNYSIDALNVTSGKNYFEFDRTSHLSAPEELSSLSGILQDGKPMSIALKGSLSDDHKNTFAWNIRCEVHGVLQVLEGG